MLDTMNDLSRLDRSELTNPAVLHLDRTTVVPVFLPDCRMALSIESNYVSQSPCYLLSSHESTPLESNAVLASSTTHSSQLFPCNGPLSSSPLREPSHLIQTTEPKSHSLTTLIDPLHSIDQSGLHLMNHITNDQPNPSVESPTRHPNEQRKSREQKNTEVHSHRGSKENALQWCSGDPVHKTFSSVPSTLWSPVSCPSPSFRPLGQLHVRTHRTADHDDAHVDSTEQCNFHSTDATMVSISALSKYPIPMTHPHLSPNLPRKEGVNGAHCTQYTNPTSSTVEAMTVRLQSLSSPPETHDELHVFTGFSNSGPAGTEEPASLEVSSETQRAMESSDSTPPSTGNSSQRNPGSKQTGQFSSVGENPGYGSDKFHPSSPTSKWAPHLYNTNMDKDGLIKHRKPFEHRTKVSESYQNDAAESSDLCPLSPQTPNAYIECRQPDKERAASLTGSEPHSSAEDSDEGMSMARFEQMTNSVQPDKAGLFFCHLCEFTGCGRQEFQDHLRSHYDYKCMKCDYTSRTEGRLKRHLKDFHSEIPPENFSGKAIKPIRSKLQRCKQCDFMTETKDEFWRHLRAHIKEDKRLECNLCCFVTEYKHHLEYHMRNHMGSKPYKCPKCNYECVNKSMLNSHMKSHSNVYPYRCANCHYATKYCHSLKLHLAKNGHKPAVVLNADGSLPSYDNTSELMSLRRGPNIRQLSARGQSNSSPDSMKDQKFVGYSDIQTTLSNSAAGMIAFGENLAVRHFVNPGTVHSNDGGANHVISPDPLPFSPCLSFPFPFTNTTVPHFSALTLSNPLLGPSGLFPSLINQSKLVQPLSEPSGLLPPPALSANLLSLDKHTISNVSIGSLPNLNGPPFPYPDPSVMAAILAAMQQNSATHGVSLAPVLTQSTIPTHVTAPSSRSTQYLCQTTHSPLNLGVATQVTSSTTPQPPLQVPLSRNTECGFTQTTGEVVHKHDPNKSLNLAEKDSPTELTMKEQRSPVKSENTDAEYALDLSSKIQTQWISQTEYARPSVSPQFRDNRTAARQPNGSRKRLRRFRSAHRIRNGVGNQFSLACSENNSSDSTDQEDRTHFDYECRFCEIRFRHRALYDIHMGFHSHADPYLCNRCGHHSRDSVDFFIHLGQMAHYS